MGTSFKTWLKGTAEGGANLVLGLAQMAARGQNPAAMADPFQYSLNFTDPNRPWVIQSLRDPVESARPVLGVGGGGTWPWVRGLVRARALGTRGLAQTRMLGTPRPRTTPI